MKMYSTKYFGEFCFNEGDEDTVINSKIKVNSCDALKDVLILLNNNCKLSGKTDEFIKIFDDYYEINKNGKNEIINNYRNGGVIKEYFEICYKELDQEILEQTFGTKEYDNINIEEIIESLDLTGLVFDYNDNEIETFIMYIILDNLITMKINKEYKLSGEMYIYDN